MNIIDPHLHLFNLQSGKYDWLRPENPPFWPDKSVICRDFNESQLALDNPLELKGFVHIEAGFDNEQPWREIEFLERNCQLPFRSVAGLDITLGPSTFEQHLIRLRSYKSVVGIRHILDDSAHTILQHPTVVKNFATLFEFDLSFDIQMNLADSTALSRLCSVLTEYPELTVIVDHMGWAPLKDKDNQQWLSGLLQISQFKHCAIKCSGWEMLKREYTELDIQKTLKQVIGAFGEDRVMLASNFPLCLFSTSYLEYWQTVASMQSFNLEKLCATNAAHWYRLNPLVVR